MTASSVIMNQSTPIRLAIVSGSSESNSKIDYRGMTAISIPLTDHIVTSVLDARPDVVLLMKGLGARTAIWLCRALKERQSLQKVPVIFYGLGDEPSTETAAFAAGADDYVARLAPASSMRARIHAILRRYSEKTHVQEPENKPSICIGEIEVQFESYLANVAGRIVPLTVGEFRVLWKLAKHVGKTLPASALSPTQLDLDGPSPDRSVRSHVWSLRRKLGRTAGAQIKTVRNAGYRLTANPT